MRRILFLGAALLLYLCWSGIAVYRYSLLDESRPADAAVVLGAAVYRGRPSPVLRERINHAIALYRAGSVNAIIFTGGLGWRDSLTEAEVAGDYAQQQGVPREAILLESNSTNTFENLQNAQLLATGSQFESYLIVSDPFHMKRAMAIAGSLGMEAYSSPTRTIRWINGLTKSRAFVRESIAYALYPLRGR